MRDFMAILTLSFFGIVSAWAGSRVVAIDERWVCNIKQSCSECLQLSHCSWCPTENKCFSNQLPSFEEFCNNDSVVHKDYGLSLEEFAECACTPPEELKQNCSPPGVQEEECYGRGRCLCGRCSCFSMIDQEHPTKMVFGEYCQYDNFSCDGPRCNEGPYSIVEEDEARSLNVDNMPDDVPYLDK
ncbi:integrin beta-like protein 1 [Amyelois transitella]|uniref:integrin beta-like protein 1 n=1 Tax=Amyelois transitella TaxID=680683 RepID=UPI00298F854F|nr:integrin beta-like protein 1 [Amyelois transitella]